MVALADLNYLDERSMELAQKIAAWAIDKLRGQEGYFYYQRQRWYTNRIPYMRWSEAWMTYALARVLELKGNANC